MHPTASQEIKRASQALGVGPRQLPRLEAESVTSAMLARFVDRETRTWWWEGFVQPHASADTNAALSLELLPRVLPNPTENVYLLTTPDDVPEISVFELRAGDVPRLLGECYGFEYVVLHPTLEWLVCESHHGAMLAVGTPVKARLEAACA